MNNVEELKSIKLIKEDGNYYLDVTYHYENEKGIYKVNIPRVLLPFPKYCIPFINRGIMESEPEPELVLNRDLRLPIREFNDGNNFYFLKEVPIRLKTRKITVAEIEKELGYKIEIVSEEKK